MYEHFGIKPSHIDFNSETWDNSSVTSDTAPESHIPVPRGRRMAVTKGHKVMLEVHERHK